MLLKVGLENAVVKVLAAANWYLISAFSRSLSNISRDSGCPERDVIKGPDLQKVLGICLLGTRPLLDVFSWEPKISCLKSQTFRPLPPPLLLLGLELHRCKPRWDTWAVGYRLAQTRLLNEMFSFDLGQKQFPGQPFKPLLLLKCFVLEVMQNWIPDPEIIQELKVFLFSEHHFHLLCPGLISMWGDGITSV